ncbi:hypothetical protein [Haloarchaeobius sp. HRN-SO-5]|uniref:hypothetical protein n=1 Tax=Haloarchaeobius sp. HRN-SO-5 TaxID=3446118 RepID=UPI003EBDF878
METKQRLKLVGYYRLLSWVSLALGLAFVGLGVYLGMSETITILLERFPADLDVAIDAADPVVTGALSAAGVVCWQVGKAFALTTTMEKAVAAETGNEVEQKLKSEVLDVVNSQLSSLETDLRKEITQAERQRDDGDGMPVGATTGGGRSGSRTGTNQRTTGATDGDDAGSAGSESGTDDRIL